MQREIVIQILTSVGYEQNALYANWFEIVCCPDNIAFKNELRFSGYEYNRGPRRLPPLFFPLHI